MRYITVILIGILSHTAWAQNNGTAEEINKRVNTDQQPQITSERLGNQSIEEFRISDRLRTMKIDPDDGPAYYLKDKTGDGHLDDSHDSMDEDVNLRKWRLGKW